jgi:hypothetical protein
MPKWEGPYTIIQMLDKVTFRVENEYRIFAVHVQRLFKVKERVLY